MQMFRYKITVEYDGSKFFGWQRQKNCISIQESIENAIEKFAHKEVTVFGAGRTDTGVHAFEQVAHFDLDHDYQLHKIKSAINHFVKPYIAVLDIETVSMDFHARFSARKKRYIYRIVNRNSHLAIMDNKAWLIKEKMDLDIIKKGAMILIGEHDFTSFRAISCQAKNSTKTIDKIDIIEKEGGVIDFIFEGKSFLHNQVRIMAGALKNIGVKKWDCKKLQEVLNVKDRKVGPETAPPYGLYLTKIWYN
ncbi:MAG: tRNA pseudouridine(38-40) synthase TruA [Candidatus Midichloria sp.]|nr:MAG: tRNA pseudouridine(38-40) synthase TruA [Candidatus Midichloria sp.]